MQEVVYIYEYVLVFFSKSWVCLGIQGHTPGAATGCAPRGHGGSLTARPARQCKCEPVAQADRLPFGFTAGLIKSGAGSLTVVPSAGRLDHRGPRGRDRGRSRRCASSAAATTVDGSARGLSRYKDGDEPAVKAPAIITGDSPGPLFLFLPPRWNYCYVWFVLCYNCSNCN